MIRINRILLALLVFLVLFASVGMVVSEGSGSVTGDDGSSDEDFSYGDDSNSGSVESDDDDDEDPLDEEYYDSEGDSGSGGDHVSVSLTKHATGNPFCLLLIVLISAGVYGLNIKWL